MLGTARCSNYTVTEICATAEVFYVVVVVVLVVVVVVV